LPFFSVLDRVEQDEVLVFSVARDDGAEEVVGGPPELREKVFAFVLSFVRGRASVDKK